MRFGVLRLKFGNEKEEGKELFSENIESNIPIRK